MTSPCAHRWLLPPPDGSKFLTATCSRCGATKEMGTSIESIEERRRRTGRDRWNGKTRDFDDDVIDAVDTQLDAA